MSSNSYSYLHDSIELEYNKTYISVKIYHQSNSCYYLQHVTLKDIKLNSLEKYLQLVQDCIDHKPGTQIQLNFNYDDSMDLITIYKSDNLNINEKITLSRYSLNENDAVRYSMNQLTKLVKKMAGEIDLLKIQVKEQQARLDELEK